MLEEERLKDLLHDRSQSQKDRLLLVLAADGATPKSVSAIRDIAVRNGLRTAKSWKPASILGGDRSCAVLTPAGWELTSAGKARVRPLMKAEVPELPTAKPAADLRSHLGRLQSTETVTFLAEAVACLEAGHLRAAIVLSWVGAVSVLYQNVASHHLAAFNAEALARDAKWKQAKSTDDLARMKEHDFLNVLESLSVIGKNVKTELQQCLSLRNACGHPNSLRVGRSRAASHIEVLLLNVFEKF
jgi:hypothetical protein